MSDDSTTRAENWDNIEVKRRRKTKKKLKLSRSSFANPSQDTHSQMENASPQMRERDSRQDVAMEVPIIYGVPYVEGDEDVAEKLDRISLDAAMKNPPKYAGSEEEKEHQSEKESQIIPSGSDKESLEVGDEKPRKIEKINTRALSKHAATYQLEKFEKNALLIFNQTNVYGYAPRLGTEKDVAELEKTFKNYGFEVTVEDDLTKEEIMVKLKEFTSQDFTDYGCVAVAVLTHGSKDGRIKAKDMPYSEIEILNHLQVRDKPTLVTKPRIVIIQACRGTKNISGIPVGQAYVMSRIQKDLDEEVEPYTLPVESDMLILHSSYIGKPSHRHELYGSWFIQSLCSKINQLASAMDIESIITEVKREVAIDRCHVERNRITYEYDTNKQMPVLTSTLIRKLYLKRFGEEPPSDIVMQNAVQFTNNSVLDNSMPGTPLLPQYGPCSCFLDHFEYIKDCLGYFVADNPEDELAQNYLCLANTYEEGTNFNTSKEVITKIICQHLKTRAADYPFYKFLYFYKH